MLLIRLPTRFTIFRTLITTTTLPSPHIPHLYELRVLCTSGHITEALSLFYSHPFPHNYVNQHIYATLFHACATHRHLSYGKALHHHILTHNPIFPNDPFDLYTTNHIINMYAKCGCLKNARSVFDKMPHRNVVSWTAVISGYAQEGMGDECFGLFVDMLVHCRPNEFAYASVLSVCDGCRGRQVHGVVVKTCFDEYVYVGNVLITMYWRNGGDDGDEAWRVFGGLRVRNLISWNSMIGGFQKRGEWVEALRFFCLMRRDGVGFDRATLLGVIGSLCGDSSDVCLVLGCCFQLHCLSIKSGFMSEIEVATALTKAYSDLGGEVSECYNIFLETSGHRDVVCWTGIMTTFSERNPEEAVFLYRQFCREGFSPDRYTYSILLKACAGLVTERQASSVHSQVMKSGFEGDTVLGNSLIHAYARTGSIAKSKKVFDGMGYRDTVSWNSMMKAYGLHGQAKEAFCTFAQMNVQPDATTFVALLSACSHAGLVDEGTKIFDSMVENYGIVPQLDHYACMIDILGRAGRVLEAEKLINEMPMAPDPVVWTTLLAACRKYGETDLANLAAKKLMELEPQKSLGYVLMSNIYCSTGSFNEAGLVRKEMKGLGVRKQPGLSWTEIENYVHEFASGGLKHPHSEAIRDNLKELVKRLKSMGYVPETSLSLHDVEEEHKAEELYYHSEKLALVFALMNTGGFRPNGAIIRIIKNIRICADCHNFMKFASELVQREIVVRDSNRFHHFKDRLCSCNDYW